MSAIEQAAMALSPEAKPDELGAVIGTNLKRLRTKRALSLEALTTSAATSSGASRSNAMPERD